MAVNPRRSSFRIQRDNPANCKDNVARKRERKTHTHTNTHTRARQVRWLKRTKHGNAPKIGSCPERSARCCRDALNCRFAEHRWLIPRRAPLWSLNEKIKYRVHYRAATGKPHRRRKVHANGRAHGRGFTAGAAGDLIITGRRPPLDFAHFCPRVNSHRS